MFDGLFIVSLIGSCVELFKEVVEKPIPAGSFDNKELIEKDKASGISDKQFWKNVESGRYKQTKKYPEPHRDEKTGKIIIENCKLYDEDLDKYGAFQTIEWVKQGKYNLTPEELEKENERIRKKFEYLYSL